MELLCHNGRPHLRLKSGNLTWIDAPLLQRMVFTTSDGRLETDELRDMDLHDSVLRGRVGPASASLVLERRWFLAEGGCREEITLTNDGSEEVRVDSMLVGVQALLTEPHGGVLPAHEGDQFHALPFRRAPWSSDPQQWSAAGLMRNPGRLRLQDDRQLSGWVPGWQHLTEGVVWERSIEGDSHCLLVLTINDRLHQFGSVAGLSSADGFRVGLGAAVPGAGQPGRAMRIAPGESVHCGVVYYRNVPGGVRHAMLAARAIFDQHGFCFPKDFDPPLHWNELYDNTEFWVWSPMEVQWPAHDATRQSTYTRADMEEEAAKAKAHGCEALYLDPGWDDSFGSFVWDEPRLGSLVDFVRYLRESHGLKLSLHCPLASWMSNHSERAWQTYPETARRRSADGRTGNIVCLASNSYLDEAARRLLTLCEAGVSFLMFDGNFWIGPCHDPGHGHGVPLSFDEHINGSLELARRVKLQFPNVMIEMHDPIAGGSRARWTPVYHGYDPRTTYDTNWGFELMWHCFDDLESGRALALYDYALSCNVPLYLHIDLREDNEHALLFWWYASTCRHLGIGGTHPNVHIAAQHRAAGNLYRNLARFYKRGSFHGISEEIHLHVLPEENSVVVNVFNLSDARKTVSGAITFAELGLDPQIWYRRNSGWIFMTPKDGGELTVNIDLPPWGHRMQVISPV